MEQPRIRMMNYAKSIRSYLDGRRKLLKNPHDLWPLEHGLAGHCYVASEALFHLTGGYDQWHVERCKVSVPEPGPGGTATFTHWYLRERESGEVTDLTSEQFEEYPHANIEIPYENGTKTGFLTEDPSKRTKKVIEKLD